jgi:hypothetical protein
VVATDINNDGWMDLFVANDTMPNFLLVNRGGGRFEEIGLEAGTAYSADGKARSGMDIDSADYNEDGWMDFFLANIDEDLTLFIRVFRLLPLRRLLHTATAAYSKRGALL